MGYKWRPSKTARREFAQKMNNDPEFAQAYNDRKAARDDKRRSGSQFDYKSAGGNYVPTKAQHDAAFRHLTTDLTSEQVDACNQVIYGYSCSEKVHHDFIHIVNELTRKEASQ